MLLGAMPARAAPPPAAAGLAGSVPYRPQAQVTGTISIWGHGSLKRDFVGELVRSWIAEFQRFQPNVRFDYRMYGTASAVGALTTGAGNLAILGEEISPDAARAFRRAKGYDPTIVEIATGSLDVNYFDYAHMIFVHRDNPLRHLSVGQLRAIFGAEAGPGRRPIRTWGDLGLGGAWADKPIHPYGWVTDSDFGLFFSGRVLANSHRWNAAISEYEHGKRPDGSQYDHGQRILDALAADPYGIAISNTRYGRSDVRALALGWTDGGPFVEASRATLVSQAYPLTRIIPAVVDRPPGGRLDPAVREFLRFILSREGQQALAERSEYLPLGDAAYRRSMDALK